MFWVSINGETLHHPNLSNDGVIVNNPTLHEELNSQGWFKATVPPNNPMWEFLTPRTSYVKIYGDRGEIWRGRIVTVERGWNNCKAIYCEGELSYLQDSVMRPLVFSGSPSDLLSALITNHNGQVDAARRFTLGNVTVTDSIDLNTGAAQKTWDVLRTVIQKLGGYIVTRKSGNTVYIDYLADFTTVSSQVVEFGENLLDISLYVDATKTFTCLIPYGKMLSSGDPGYQEPPASGTWDGNKLTIKSVNSGNDYLKHTSGVSLWGEVWGTQTWTDIQTASALKTKATDYLAEMFLQSLTIEVTAIDLSYLSIDISGISVGTYTRVKSPLHMVDELLLCRSRETPLTQLQNSKIMLGAGEKTLSDLQGEELNR